MGPAEVMLALSPGWWKGWGGRKPLTDEFVNRGRGFNVLSVTLTEAQNVIELWTTTRTAICRVTRAGSVANPRRG